MAKTSPTLAAKDNGQPEIVPNNIGIGNNGDPANEAKHQDAPKIDPDTLEQACIALLSSRMFSELLSSGQVDKASIRAANRVANVLAEQGNAAIDLNGTSGELTDRIAFISRGKRLYQQCEDLTQRMALVTQAMLTGQCLTAKYNHRTRELHPHGIVVREPKIYVIATETADAQAAPCEQVTPIIKQYALNRFATLDISAITSSVPDDFNINQYIDAGHMDVNIPILEKQLGQQFDLVMRMREKNNDALLRDLQDFSLDKQREALIKPNGQENYQLTVPNQAPTYALTDWILGRSDRVEVIAPLELRSYLSDQLQATYKLYSGDQEQPHRNTSITEPQADGEDNTGKVRNTNEKKDKRRSVYTVNTKENTLTANLVLRVFNSIEICEFFLRSRELHAIDPLFDGAIGEFIGESSEDDDVTGFTTWLNQQLELPESEEPDLQDPLIVNINEAKTLLSLSEVETDLLRLSALLQANLPLRKAFGIMSDDQTEDTAIEILAAIVQQPIDEVTDALHNFSILRKAGIIGRDEYSSYIHDLIIMPSYIARNLFTHHESKLGLLSGLVVGSPESNLEIEDFEHLDKQISMATCYLKGAIAQEANGCNILLWGTAGTGKTQLARCLADQLSNISAWEVMSTTSHGDTLTELDRMSSYRFTQAALGGSNQSVVIFDEVENILEPSYSVSRKTSKASVNELLEHSKVPSIWISNAVDGIDPAYLRRFDVVIEVQLPVPAAKKRMARRILNNVPINGELLTAFLERQEVGPAFLQKIRRVAQLTGADTEQAVGALATNLLHSEIALSNGPPAALPDPENDAKALPSLPYDFSLINASEDLGGLSGTLRPDVNVKFCLYGPPGTGKTAWAKQLATQMNKPAHVVQASDIKDQYVGESEKNIANAFKLAHAENAVLIFDEVESFLSNRSEQNHSYAVSTTNQFLTSLENYKGLVVCSTNLMDSIDAAALRRFDFKVKFSYLTAVQANQMLVSTAQLLGMEISVGDLLAGGFGLKANTYAPGDFPVVLKRSQIRTGEVTLERLFTDVRAEAEMRSSEKPGRSIGFL